MIVSCPSCGARYRLSDEAASRPRTLRCAECRHEWSPDPSTGRPSAAPFVPRPAPRPLPVPPPAKPAPAPPPAEPPPPPPQAAPPAPAIPSEPPPTPAAKPRRTAKPAPKPAAAEEEDKDVEPVTWNPGQRELDMLPARLREGGKSRRRPVLLFAIALIVVALLVAVAGVWLGRVDIAQVPLVGDRLQPIVDRFLPAPSPVRVVSVKARTTQLSGGLVLDVTIRLRNDGNQPAPAPALAAELAGPAGVALRWRVPPAGGSIAPGATIEAASAATGFPREATRLSLSVAR
jgi:predicted Zn finger-like uncharacterized protein